MHNIKFTIKPAEHFTLERVLVACGFLPQEITSTLLEDVWNNPSNTAIFKEDAEQNPKDRRDKYSVAGLIYIYVPWKDLHHVPVATGNAQTYKMLAGFTLFVSNGPVIIGSDEEEDIYLAQDEVYGQAGWMFSTSFGDFAGLANKLGNGGWSLPKTFCDNSFFDCGPVQPNQIERLGICCHGDSGAIGVNGAPYSDPTSATWKDSAWLNITTISLAEYQDSFQKILRALAPGAKVFFLSCLAANSDQGTELFRQISLLWASKGVTVVGFKSVLFSGGNLQKVGNRHYVGARVTHYDTNKIPGDPKPRFHEKEKYWRNLALMPWADEHSPHATIAREGKVIQMGADPIMGGVWDGYDDGDLSTLPSVATETNLRK